MSFSLDNLNPLKGGMDKKMGGNPLKSMGGSGKGPLDMFNLSGGKRRRKTKGKKKSKAKKSKKAKKSRRKSRRSKK
jgi:hypothetical protein